jgi:hypothetical protein
MLPFLQLYHCISLDVDDNVRIAPHLLLTPNNFHKLLKNCPHSRNYNTAICRQKYIEFIGSDAVGGIVNYMSEKHKKAWIGDDSLIFVENYSGLPRLKCLSILNDLRKI